MKKLVLSLMFIIVATAANADSYSYLVVEANDGTTTSFALTDLTITFSDGSLVASNGTTLTLADLAKMYFGGTTDKVQLNTTNDDTAVKIYSPSGTLVAETTNANLATACSRLPKGIYVINNGETTKKVMLK